MPTPKPKGKAKAEPKAQQAGPTSKRTPQLEGEVLSRLSSGEPLTVICRDVGIHYTTWREWCRADEALDIAHAHARDVGYDAIATRTRQTARGKDEAQGGESSGDVQRDKLIIDTDLKLLAKWDPRRYGEKTQTEISGPNGGPIQHADLTDEELERRIAQLSSQA